MGGKSISAKVVCLFAAFSCWAGLGFSETVIYSDDFSGVVTGKLNGQFPSVGPENIRWKTSPAGTVWQADGTIGSQAVNQNRNAFLPFVPESGNVYILSLDMNPEGPAPGEFFALGFASNNKLTDAYVSNDGMSVSPWIFVAANGTVRTYSGPGNAGNVAAVSPKEGWGEWVSVKLILDTTAGLWKAEWFVNGNSVRTHTFYTGNPEINYVTFGRFRRTSGAVDNFKLAILPE